MTKPFSRLCLLILLSGCSEPIFVDKSLESQSTDSTLQVSRNYVDKGFQDDRKALAYAIGLDKGRGSISRYQYLKERGIELDREEIKKGFVDAISDSYVTDKDKRKARLNSEDLKSLIYGFEREVAKIEQSFAQKEAIKNRIVGKKYLDKNAKKNGVTTLVSGLQYKVLQQGSGASPTYESEVTIGYIGRLIDGTEFANSYRNEKQPEQFRVASVISGWSEALQLMRVGDKWEITLPSHLAYGSSRRGNIPADSVLVFEIELLGVSSSFSW
ncbi:FKBP-type peptidyl-prolyl cis-trans isomerase [Aliikangiella coralliicola]|uniref:Peptidyl-prolyl cis-trans isomerase n=1 Tax=Aliikangiella coralliicola TaxID=2592383 RepID=A0A545U654_9GAMM|nr:FKBP-type peptidyl-prolyl cis-trans isomerase [Aliikangiella coralliicola]TQV84958.1 FKBP-type peptidyl-prolyl cis-trans isomerase [Aliikangiella coralliicola]